MNRTALNASEQGRETAETAEAGQDEIPRSKDIFGLEHPESIFADVKAKIIYHSAPGDIINQLITFCGVPDRQIQEYGGTREAVEETLRICKKGNVQKEYPPEGNARRKRSKETPEGKARRKGPKEMTEGNA